MARLFAVALLAWTTADLAGHGVCCHDREPIAPGLPTGSHETTAVGTTGAPAAQDDSNGPDDCFCCCRCVDVRTPFELVVASSFISEIIGLEVADPRLATSPLYHPPLA